MFERILQIDARHPDHPQVLYQSTLLRQAGVLHGFSTRQAGLATHLNAEWDLAAVRDPATGRPLEGYQRLLHAADCPNYPLVHVQQVHGSSVLMVDANDVTAHLHAQSKAASQDPPDSADGLVTATPGLALTMRVADCVPLLLAVTVQGQPVAIAAVHAGWRGLVAGIIPEALRTLHLQLEQYGKPLENHQKHADMRILCAIGPCISARHFEVGHEVAAAFTDANLDAAIVENPNQKPHINLPLAAKLQLQAGGLREADIDMGSLCTFELEKDFFSHRRDHGQTGRLAAVIALKTTSQTAGQTTGPTAR